MRKPTQRTPSYCLHKASGQAVVRIDGTDHYLGKYDTPDSRAEYDRLIAEWLGNGRRLPTSSMAAGLSVNEVILAFWRHAEQHYRAEDGAPTGEADNSRDALRPLKALYGHTAARDFGPLALRAVRDAMVKAGLSRGVVNARINRIRRVFKWAASFELVPATVSEALRTLAGLQKGRSQAREGDGVKPVAEEHVTATLPYLPAPVRAMTELQLLTGMRVGEVMVIRAIDLTMSGPVWAYRPYSHKNKYRGRDRVIYLGPQAQAVIKPFLTTNLEAYLFSPRAATEAMRAGRAARRKTERTASQFARKPKARPKRAPGERYRRHSYRQAVRRACQKRRGERAVELYRGSEITLRRAYQRAVRDFPLWSPLQLRHTAATAIRARYGVEAAKVILGHTRVETSQIYAERDLNRAEEIMREIG
jgi:site-specific recombinase XerD